MFDQIGLHDFRMIVEADEFDIYSKEFGAERILELPQEWKDRYDHCDEFGTSLSSGSGPARNYAWHIAREEGAKWHWTIDDNLIFGLMRYSQTGFVRARDGQKFFGEMESMITSYNNVFMGGPHCEGFIIHGYQGRRLFNKNSRIYSFNLIRTGSPFQWRGRYNEDTILTLDMLHNGCATLLLNSHLMKKPVTRTQKGGNTDKLYKHGTGPKSRVLFNEYPQYVKLLKRWGRMHHHIDYKKHFEHLPIHYSRKKVEPTPVHDPIFDAVD